MTLPKTKRTDQIGELAVTYTQEYIERHGWKFRRQSESDYGIDAEFEIVDSNYVTGKVCKCQIKGMQLIEWKSDIASVQVKISTYNLWKATHLPVIIFLCDTSTRQVYWTFPLAQSPTPNANSISIKFNRENLLEKSLESLSSFLHSWFAAFSVDNILREVPYFHKAYSELSDSIDHFDAWCPVHEEEDFKLRLLYRHTLQLRCNLGLKNEEIPPLDHWFIRNEALWDARELFWGTFNELMSFIKPYYEEAVTVLRKKMEGVQYCIENQELMSFFNNLDRHTSIDVILHDSRVGSDPFHAKMESLLKENGSLRYSWFDKKQK